MKKIASLMIAICMCTGIQAQFTWSETQWFVRGGLNVMGIAGDGGDNLDSKLGYNVVAGFQKEMRGKGAYVGMELGLGSRGYNYDLYSIEEKLIAHNIQFSPITFGWKLTIDESVKIDAHVGTFLALDYTGTAKVRYPGQSKNISMGDWEEWNEFDAGINIGIGFWINRFNIDFTYQRGFVEVIDHKSRYTSNLVFRLGVAL